MANVRYANGNFRRKCRMKFKAMGLPCAICQGRLGEIHYDEPSDHMHPLSFVIDEIKPVSRWREFGYESARAAVEDIENLQPAHYCCNAMKGNKVGYTLQDARKKVDASIKRPSIVDGDW